MMKRISITLDNETLKDIIDYQKETETFNRSSAIRKLIRKGLENKDTW